MNIIMLTNFDKIVHFLKHTYDVTVELGEMQWLWDLNWKKIFINNELTEDECVYLLGHLIWHALQNPHKNYPDLTIEIDKIINDISNDTFDPTALVSLIHNYYLKKNKDFWKDFFEYEIEAFSLGYSVLLESGCTIDIVQYNLFALADFKNFTQRIRDGRKETLNDLRNDFNEMFLNISKYKIHIKELENRNSLKWDESIHVSAIS